MDFFHVCSVPAAGVVQRPWCALPVLLCCLPCAVCDLFYHYLLLKIQFLAYTCESPLLSLNHLDCNMNIYCYYIDDDGKWHRLVHKHRYQRCEMFRSFINHLRAKIDFMTLAEPLFLIVDCI